MGGARSPDFLQRGALRSFKESHKLFGGPISTTNSAVIADRRHCPDDITD
jgi:hypothetical protein